VKTEIFCYLPSREAIHDAPVSKTTTEENQATPAGEKSRPTLKIGHFTLEMPTEAELPNIIFSMIPARWLEFTDEDMRGSFLDILWFYLHYCYLFCIIPFKLRRDSESNYRLAHSRFQNVGWSK